MHRLVLVALVLLLTCGCGEGTRETSRAAESPAPPASADERRAVDAAYVLASRAGVELVAADGERTSVSEDPAAVAFGLSGDLVILQRSGPPGAGYPPRATGPIELWSGGRLSELPTDANAAASPARRRDRRWQGGRGRGRGVP